MSRKKNKKQGMRIVYESVGTKEEQQERMDRIFDLIFSEALKRWRRKIWNTNPQRKYSHFASGWRF